jgi:glycosyltransferase involved in cell wall biosynthesis
VKVLFLYRFCTLGGVETVLRHRLDSLARRGVAVSLAFLDDLGGSATFRDAPVADLCFGRREIGQLLAQKRFDFILPIDTPEVEPLLRGSGGDAIVVAEVHSNHAPNLEYLHALDGTSTRAIIVPSAHQRDLVLRDFPAVRRAGIPVFVVPNPIDPALFRFVPPPRVPERPVVGWVGRLEPQKNWRQFVAIAAELTRTGADLDFILVGGARAPDAVKDTLRSLVTRRELAARFRWVSALAYERMPAFFSLLGASGGCLVPTSAVEPFGMTVLEAMACDAPVVAPRVDAFAELIEDGVSGLHFPPGDTLAATEAVRRVLADGDLRERLRAGGRDRVAARFTADRSVDRFLEVLSALRADAAPSALGAAS